MQKYVYRVLVVNTELKTQGGGRDYDDLLEDDYVRDHLYYMVAANLKAKKSISQPRTWRLPHLYFYMEDRSGLTRCFARTINSTVN